MPSIQLPSAKALITKPLLIWFLMASISTALLTQNLNISSYGETGKGEDVFKVIMTVFGVENTKGDVITMVIVNNGEASRVKLIETKAFKPVSSNLTSLGVTPSPSSNAAILEYVSTFPNVTVNSGVEYKACIMTTKNLELLCKTGHNSPASRPEFVDINLDEPIAGGTEQLQTEEQQSQIEEQDQE
jgi:hypothetical protein